LREIACDCDFDARPKNRFDRIVTTERLVEAGLGRCQPLASMRGFGRIGERR
jgi:hypothetical protein